MTGSYLTNIISDSMTGLLFCLESVKNSVVILNGPTGCKFYHTSIADDQGQRQRRFDPLSYPLQFFYCGNLLNR